MLFVCGGFCLLGACVFFVVVVCFLQAELFVFSVLSQGEGKFVMGEK